MNSLTLSAAGNFREGNKGVKRERKKEEERAGEKARPGYFGRVRECGAEALKDSKHEAAKIFNPTA